MQYSIARTQRASQVVNAICALLFILFCSCYMFFFQRDFLSFAQHYYSSGRNVDHGYYIVSLIVFALTSLGLILQHVLHLPIRLRALHWFPSLLVLSAITNLPIGTFTQEHSSFDIFGFSILLLAYILVLFVSLRIRENRSENASFSLLCWPNLLIMLLGFFVVGCFSNTDRLFHQQLRVERAVGEGRYQDAYDEMNALHIPSAYYTSLWAYALDQEGELGERFFQSDFIAADGLLPSLTDSLRPWNITRRVRERLGGLPVTSMNPRVYLEYLSKDTLATDHLADYHLVACLLDKNLKDFAERLLVYYPSIDTISHNYTRNDSLPLHYREALCLCSMYSTESACQLSDSILYSRYLEFDSLAAFSDTLVEYFDTIKERFEKTYWYYYQHTK